MENIEVMVILFIIVVLGYALCKLSYMGDRFDQKLSSIVIDITCPALILSSVMGKELPDRTLILPLLGVGFLTYILLLVFGFWVPRFVSKKRDEQGMIGFALMFANVGFIGYPIVSSIFGPKSIFYAALLNMPNTFFIFTAGVMLVKGEYSIKCLTPKVLLLHKSQTYDTRPQNTAIIPRFCTISSMGAMQTRWQTCNYVIILRGERSRC